MTEEEAKTKRCVHRGLDRGSINYCVGPSCMAWRKLKDTFMVTVEEGKEPKKFDWDIRTHSAYDGEKVTEVLHGFCGLAGKP